MRFQFNGLLIFLFFLVCQDIFAQTYLNLENAFDLLEKQNIDIHQSKLSRELSRQEVKDAKNALLPRLSLGASRNYNLGLAFDQVSGQLVTGNRWSNTANANINTQATIFQGFGLRNQIKDALLSLERTEVEMEGLSRSLKIELLTLFFDAITNQSLHESSLEQLAFSQEQLSQQMEQFELGTKTLVDVSLAESQVATDELNTLVSGNAYKRKTIEIKQLLNIPYADSILLHVPAQDVYMADLVPSYYTRVLDRDPQIRVVELGVDQANLGLTTARNRYYPTLSFSGGYGTNYSSERRDFFTGAFMPFWNQVDQNRALYFGLSLNIPILDGFRVKSDINRAKIQIQIQQNELEKTKLEQEKIYRLAYQDYEQARQEFVASQTRYTSLKRALEAMKERYDLGIATALDFSKSVLDHNMAEFSVISAKYNLLLSVEILNVLLDRK